MIYRTMVCLMSSDGPGNTSTVRVIKGKCCHSVIVANLAQNNGVDVFCCSFSCPTASYVVSGKALGGILLS